MSGGSRSRGSLIQKLSVIIPCFNEAANVPLFQTELLDALRALGVTTEVIFVDDGSIDDTRAALEKFCAANPGMTVRSHERNQGLGAAIRTGLASATGDAVATLDADLTFHPRQISLLMKSYDEADAVLGSPQLGGFEQVNWARRILSNGVNLVYQLLFGRRITATSSVFRLYRTSAIRSLALECDSFDINAEIVFKLLRHGFRVREVPVRLTVRRFGVSKINVPREVKNHLRMFVRILGWRLASRSAKRAV